MISPHEVRVFMALDEEQWLDAAEIAVRAKVHPRTARLHLQRMRELAVAEWVEVYPAFLYRLAASGGDLVYLEQLAQAAEAFAPAAGA